jgi:hypothetical protein
LRVAFKEDESEIMDGTIKFGLYTWSNTKINGLYLDGFTMRVDE